MNAKRLVLPVVLIGAAAGGYAYWNRTPDSLTLTGIVNTNDVIVSPQIAGRIEKLLVKEGDEVAADQLIAVLSPDELRAESAYATHNVAGVASQITEAQAALRYEQRQMEEQVRQAQSNLAATEAQQAAAEADLEAARLNFNRTQQLSREGVASAQELDQSRTAFQSAQAKLDAVKKQADAHRAAVDLARTNAEQVAMRRGQLQVNQHMQEAATAQRTKADVRLAYTEVKAPMAGIVDVRAARPGEVVSAGQPIVSLVNPDDLWVRADVEETYIDRVRIGDKIQVRLPSGTERECAVIYRGVDAAYATQRDVSRTKRDIKTFEVRLRCDNADRRLAVGMTAYVELPLK